MKQVTLSKLPLAVLPFAVLLLAGCQGTSSTEKPNLTPQYASGAEVRDALNRAGLGCENFQTVNRDVRDIGESAAQEVSSCRVDNTDVVIMTWLKLGQAQDWALNRQTLGCQLAQALGTTPPVDVDGGRWTIALNSRPLATKIADAIGGQARFPDCASVD